MEKLRELRKKKGLTQVELARRMQCAQAQVSAWENGVAPTIKSLQRLAKALGVKAGELLQ
jgi:transcriptional regulator with XRE-family HTH domain